MILNWKKMNNLQGLYKKVWKLSLHPELEMEIDMEMEICINLYHSRIQQVSGNFTYFFYLIPSLNFVV